MVAHKSQRCLNSESKTKIPSQKKTCPKIFIDPTHAREFEKQQIINDDELGTSQQKKNANDTCIIAVHHSNRRMYWSKFINNVNTVFLSI